jgi:hypothetical protein
MAYQFRDFDFLTKQVTAIKADTNSPGYLWVAFSLNENSVCKLQKRGGHDVSQLYYDIDLSVDSINSLEILFSYIYLAVNNSENLGYRYVLSTPLTTETAIVKPVSVTENPIDLVGLGSYIYYLTPGTESGEFAKVIKLNTSGVVQEILTMDASAKEIHGAKSITTDGSNLWIVTTNTPTELIRVYDSGGLQYEVTELTV